MQTFLQLVSDWRDYAGNLPREGIDGTLCLVSNVFTFEVVTCILHMHHALYHFIVLKILF